MSASSVIDVDVLLSPVSPASPCGENLEYDRRFLDLELALKGKPEVQYGSSVTPATPPDWKAIKRQSLELSGETHDLRVAMLLSRALLKLHGLPGFAQGLSLIERMLSAQWENLYPQLDPDDDNDPTSRINVLAALTDPSGVLRDIRAADLTNSRTGGRFSLRQIDIATGEIEPAGDEEKTPMSSIDMAFQDTEPAELLEVHEALEMACTHLAAIEKVLTEKVGVGRALDLGAPSKMLKRARDFVGERISRRVDLPLAGQVAGAAKQGDGAVTAAPRVAAGSGEISSRDDVIHTLEKICQYYARHEPTSPVPLLLERAQRLVTKNFIELLEDLAPDGLNQLYQISGTNRES